MTAQEMRKNALRFHGEAQDLIEQASAEKDEARQDELFDQASKARKDYEKWSERAKEAAALEDAQARADEEAKANQRETPAFFDDSAPKDRNEPFAEVRSSDIARRNDLRLRVRNKDESLTEEEVRESKKVFDVERLWGKVMAFRIRSKQTPDRVESLRNRILSREEQAAWEAYERSAEEALRLGRNERALPTGGQNVTPDAAGGTLLPQPLVDRIVSYASWYGPMGVGNMDLDIFNFDTTASIKVPVIADESEEASVVAPGADADAQNLAHSRVTLTPQKYTSYFPITFELLMGGNVNLEAHIMEKVGTYFGRKINKDFTTGTGAITLGVASDTTAGSFVKTSAAAIAEADIYALFAMLDWNFVNHPTTCVQMSQDVYWDLTKLRDATGGNRVFPLDPATRLMVLPGRAEIKINNALARKTGNAYAADAKLAVYGALRYFGVVVAGGMRMENDFNVRGDYYELAWHQFAGCQPLRPAAFKRLDRSS